jgi:tetratricopeptide (TPR) repeat protein
MGFRDNLSNLLTKFPRGGGGERSPHKRGRQSDDEDQENTIIEQRLVNENGVEVPHLVDDESDTSTADSRKSFWGRVPGFVLIGVPLLILLLLLVSSLGDARAADDFVILVAPFQDERDPRTGRNVADALVEELRAYADNNNYANVVVRSAGSAPADAAAALALVQDRQADVLVWGRVSSGGLLNDTTLFPRLTYAPQGTYGPNAWIGYMGRFRMPHSYMLTDEQTAINGQVILPQLLMALADYNQGQADTAYVKLGDLLQDYPQVHPALPLVLRGNALWARGAYEQAASIYVTLLDQPDGVAEDETALLYNNLGAILLDAGDELAAESALLTASQRMRQVERDLGELRFNLGILAQRQEAPAEAVAALEPARNLLGDNSAVLLELSQAYRQAGQLDAAENALDAAARQVRQDVERVPTDQRQLITKYFQAALSEQRGLLELSRTVNAHGRLTWELEIVPPPPPNELAVVQEHLRNAVEVSEELRQIWRSRVAATSTAAPGSGLVANGQTERVERTIDRRRYYRALVLTEVGRTRTGPQNVVSRLQDMLSDNGTPLEEAQRILADLRAERPGSLSILIAHARALRLEDEYDRGQVEALYDRVIELAPTRPEGYYGKGMLRLNNGEERAAARQFMEQALENNALFFPARMQLVNIAEEEGDLLAVLNQLEVLRDQRPDDPVIRLRIAETLMRQGEIAEAQAVYRQVLTIDTNNPEARFGLARTQRNLAESGESDDTLEDALQNVDATLARRPDYSEALLFKGEVLYALDQPDAANQAYQDALEVGMTDVSSLIAVGNTLLDQGNPRIAADAFKRAVERQPDNPWAHHGLGQAYLELDSLDYAAEEEQRVLELTNPDDPILRELRIDALVALGDIARQMSYADPSAQAAGYEQAERYYRQALDLDNTLVNARLGLGQVVASRGNWQQALDYFEEALDLPTGASDPQVHFWVAEAFLRQPDLDPVRGAETYRQFMERSQSAYQEALALQPDFPEAWLGLAHAQLALNEREAAVASIDQALDFRPAYAEALLFRGNMLKAEGNLSAALEAYNNAVEANDRIPEVRYRRALLYIQLENYEDAMRDLQRAVARQSNFAEAYFWLGHTHLAQNEMQKARTAFEQAVVAQGGRYPAARFYQGLAEENLGRYEEAIASFEDVIIHGGPGDWAAQARVELERITLHEAELALPGLP